MPNPDQMIYFVLAQFRSGLEWVARDPANMSRKETLVDIRSGELPNVLVVMECNIAEHICSLVSMDDDFVDAIFYANNRQNMQAAE